MKVKSVARYDSGFGIPQKNLFEELLNERKVAEEFLENYDEETSVHDSIEYADYLTKIDELIIAMKNLYELEVEE
jgi:hypothetical protein